MQKIRRIINGKYFWLVAIIVFCFSRIATWLFPFDSDHWIFYYVGRLWAQGSTLYVDMWDHKSPLIFGYNAFLFKLFGGNIVLHRIFFTLIALLGLWLFYITAKLLYKTLQVKKHEFFARVSTLLFAFFANLSQFTNSGNNNENLAIVALLGCLYLYLKYRAEPLYKQGVLMASGILAGIVLMLKGNFTILLLPIFLDLLILNYKNIYRLISSFAFFTFGILFQLLIWAWYFKDLGTFKQFFIATFEFNSKYIKALGWDYHAPGLMIFLGIILALVLFFAPFMLKAIKSISNKKLKMRFFMPSVAISVIIFMILAGTFYSHYFLVVIPYLCLIAGAYASEVLANYKKIMLAIFTLLIIFMMLISVKQLYNSYYGSVAVDAKNQTAAANYINNHTNKDDKFFAYTYGATFYRLADRNSGSRFISASHLLIDYKYQFGYDFNKTFILDMEDSEAKYVVMSSDQKDIYREQNPVLMLYFRHNYHLETTINGYDIYRRNI